MILIRNIITYDVEVNYLKDLINHYFYELSIYVRNRF